MGNGPGGVIETHQGKMWGQRAAKTARQDKFDGIDYDFDLHEDNSSFLNGNMKIFLADLLNATRTEIPYGFVSFSAKAKYFSRWAMDDCNELGYVGFMKNYQDEI